MEAPVILAFDSRTSDRELERLAACLRERGLDPVVSRGGEQVVVAAGGGAAPAELAAWMADLPGGQLIPILTRDEYRRRQAGRRFLRGLMAGLALLVALGVLIPVLDFLDPPATLAGQQAVVAVSRATELAPGAARLLHLQGQAILLVRRAPQRFHALAARCTHAEACLLEWHEERGQVLCPCHGDAFDLYGNVAAGPAARPLRSYPVELRGDQVFLHLDG